MVVLRTWWRRAVFPTPEFPMMTSLTVRMGVIFNVHRVKIYSGEQVMEGPR